MSVYKIDPLQDPRWPEFLQAHSQASIFHTPGWLQSLQRTYGYEPLVLTTCPPPAPLTNGVVFCRIKSWLTGERMVSVPFADHCQPLFESIEDFYSVLESTRGAGGKPGKPVEIRPLDSDCLGLTEHSSFQTAETFRIHLLDLKPDLDEILASFDKSSVQRRLRRVAREDLVYEEGGSPALLEKFYRLLMLTRRKHQIPPQPMAWFRNLVTSLGDGVKIRVVSKDKTPIASILTLSYKETVIYKYGCSDANYNNLAGTPLLFWLTIQEAKTSGAHIFDMGRSDLDNPGLIKFKSNWGTRDIPLTYWRWPQGAARRALAPSAGKKLGGYVVSHLPDNVLIMLGKALYRHMG
jgi:hypothetical protein